MAKYRGDQYGLKIKIWETFIKTEKKCDIAVLEQS